MQASERHVAVLPVSTFEETYVFFCTEKGIVKKTPLSAFSNPRPSGIQAITLDPDDSLLGVQLTDGKQEVVIGTRDGMACRFNEDDVRPMGRSARGVWGIRQPTADAPEVAPDILLVPLTVFDRRGHRIGYGAGYYDMTITKLRALKPIVAIGLAFAVQEVDEVPTTPRDARLDLVLTEREVIDFRKA